MPRANAEGIPIIKLLLPFQLQQILLHLHAIGVAGEPAGAAHHPVAGLKDGDGVAVAGTAHGTAGLGFANSGGQLGFIHLTALAAGVQIIKIRRQLGRLAAFILLKKIAHKFNVFTLNL